MSKRILIVALALLMILLSSQPAAASDIRVMVDGEWLNLDVPPLVEEGRTLIPARAISERLGATVDWDPVSRRVEIRQGATIILLTIDSTTALVNAAPETLDVPARIVDGRTLVPARFISENLNCQVEWDPVTRIVTITSLGLGSAVDVLLGTEEAAVLARLNQARRNLGLDNLILVDDLSTMARSHAADMSSSGQFSHHSARYGDLASRAVARGLRVDIEYLARGLPDGAAIAATMLSSERGSQLLAREARFVGIGLYQAAGSGNDNIYAVLELVMGEGMILGPRERQSTDGSLILNGYAAVGAVVNIYLLDGPNTYISRRSQTVQVSGQDNNFSLTIELWERGDYAIMLGSERILVRW